MKTLGKILEGDYDDDDEYSQIRVYNDNKRRSRRWNSVNNHYYYVITNTQQSKNKQEEPGKKIYKEQKLRFCSWNAMLIIYSLQDWLLSIRIKIDFITDIISK